MAHPARPTLVAAPPVAGTPDVPADELTEADRYRAAVAAAPAILFAVCLRTGALRWVSENVERLSGYPAATFTGEGWLAHVHPDDAGRLEETLRVLRATGRWNVEFRLRHASGVYRWFRSTG